MADPADLLDPEVSADPIEGRCLCGAVTLRTSLYRRAVSACHCGMCQAWTGGAFLAFGSDAGATTVEGPVVRHPSSDFAERAFCGRCGSHLWFRETGEASERAYEFLPGLFPAAAGWPLTREVYADRAMACARWPGDHVRVTRAEYESRKPFVAGEGRAGAEASHG